MCAGADALLARVVHVFGSAQAHHHLSRWCRWTLTSMCSLHTCSNRLKLMLAASLHGLRECGERQMLVQHLDRLSSTDLLLLDRGYPARWLVSLLNHRQQAFCMRVEQAGTGGFSGVREFRRSGRAEQTVTLRATNSCDADSLLRSLLRLLAMLPRRCPA